MHQSKHNEDRNAEVWAPDRVRQLAVWRNERKFIAAGHDQSTQVGQRLGWRQAGNGNESRLKTQSFKVGNDFYATTLLAETLAKVCGKSSKQVLSKGVLTPPCERGAFGISKKTHRSTTC